MKIITFFRTLLLSLGNLLPLAMTLNLNHRDFAPALITTTYNNILVDRSQNGNVPYGAFIYHCNLPNKIALTFDDGPSIVTGRLLDLFDKYNVHTTMFVSSNNGHMGPMENNSIRAQNLVRAFNSGHQIGSHTYTHPDFNTLSDDEMIQEMIENERSIYSIIGVIPKYFRPPYIRCGPSCLNVMNTLGYHVIGFDLDSDDWRSDSSGSGIAHSEEKLSNYFESSVANDSFIVLEHDLPSDYFYNIAEFALQQANYSKKNIVTLGDCLGDPHVCIY